MQVHPRIHEAHPELTDEDVRAAWENQLASAMRPDAPNFPCIVAIGADAKGRLVEMIATLGEDGWLVYHAFTPPTRKMLDEIFPEGRNWHGRI